MKGEIDALLKQQRLEIFNIQQPTQVLSTLFRNKNIFFVK